MEFARIAIDLIVGFFALLFITKGLGKTQITQITPFDFISALVLGELVGNAVYDKDIGFKQILFAVLLWGILILIIEIITQKFMKTRKFLEGEPTIVIRKGIIIKKELKKARLDLNQLQHLLRSKDVFSIRDAEYAILETDGSLSVIKKPQNQAATLKDLNIKGSDVNLSFTLISDGQVLRDNLRQCGFDTDWLTKQIKNFDAEDIKDVFYAEWQEGKGFYAQKY